LHLSAVIFDLDGVLVDSEPAQLAAWNDVLAQYGCALDEGLVRELFGLRVRDSARKIVDYFHLPCDPTALLAEREAVFFDSYVERITLMPGVAETLVELAAQGVPLGLATSGHRRYVERLLPLLTRYASFAAIVTGDDVARGKPAPDCYRIAVQQLGVSPSSTLAIEDAPLGIAAAKAAGLFCVAVPNRYTAELPGLALADVLLPRLDALLPWLHRSAMLNRPSREEREHRA